MAILIVDDSVETLNLLSLALGMRGFGITTAHNGQEALDILKSGRALPELILSNMYMPILDGMTLLETIRNSPTLAHIPFVMMTAAPQPEIQDQAYELGANAFIIKPFKLELLIATLRQFVTPA